MENENPNKEKRSQQQAKAMRYPWRKINVSWVVTNLQLLSITNMKP